MDGDGHLFWDSKSGVSGAHFGMAGCLVSTFLGQRDPWLFPLVNLLIGLWIFSFSYLADQTDLWVVLDFWDADDFALEMVDHPNIWTCGSGEKYLSGGFEVAGSGVYFPALVASMLGSVWGVSEEYGDALVDRCREFTSVLDPLQSVQRAEFWGAIVVLQACYPCHFDIEILIHWLAA